MSKDASDLKDMGEIMKDQTEGKDLLQEAWEMLLERKGMPLDTPMCDSFLEGWKACCDYLLYEEVLGNDAGFYNA